MSDLLIKKIIKISLWIGVIDSIYLAYIKLAHKESICAGFGQCELVQASSYSEIFGVPIAVFGIFIYLFLLFVLANETKIKFFERNSLFIIFGFTFAGFLYSLYLTYIEVYVLNAICPFCVVSAIVMTIAFIGSTVRLKKYFEEE